MPAEEIDKLIHLLLRARPRATSPWLSVTFDDGYQDAADYIRTRASRFPQVEFIFFVCPEKAHKQAGFRWDLVEESLRAGTPKAQALSLMTENTVVESENSRPDLLGLAKQPYSLCTVDELKSLQKFPNVSLGNHTNLHLSSARTDDVVIGRDFSQSTADFEKLLGAQKHFAFPFGTPGHHFAQRHVDWLRALGDFTIWTTEARPYLVTERETPHAVLPRFPVNGRKSAAALAGWVAARCLLWRWRSRNRAAL